MLVGDVESALEELQQQLQLRDERAVVATQHDGCVAMHEERREQRQETRAVDWREDVQLVGVQRCDGNDGLFVGVGAVAAEGARRGERWFGSRWGLEGRVRFWFELGALGRCLEWCVDSFLEWCVDSLLH